MCEAIAAQIPAYKLIWAEEGLRGVAYRKTQRQRGSPACCPAPVTSLGQTRSVIRHAFSTIKQHVRSSRLQVTPSLPILRLPGHGGGQHTTLVHHMGARCRMTAAVSIAIGARQQRKTFYTMAAMCNASRLALLRCLSGWTTTHLASGGYNLPEGGACEGLRHHCGCHRATFSGCCEILGLTRK